MDMILVAHDYDTMRNCDAIVHFSNFIFKLKTWDSSMCFHCGVMVEHHENMGKRMNRYDEGMENRMLIGLSTHGSYC